MKYAVLFLLLLVTACVKEPVGYYLDQGVVEITADTAQVIFNVPDPDNNGWNPGGDGEVAKVISLTMKEKSGRDLAITGIYWVFYNISDGYVDDGYLNYHPPFEVPDGSETPLDLTITVTEAIANNLDDHDGAHDDYSGTGTIKITVGGYDLERGNAINVIPVYIPIRVSR